MTGPVDGFELSRTGRSLPIALLRAREKVMDRFRPVLHRHGITEQQWRVLRVLEETPGADMGAVAAATNILAPSLSRIAKGLEDRGLIDAKRTADDGRRASLILTAKGTAFIQTVAPDSAAARAEIEALIGAEALETLLDQLDHVLQALGNQ